MRTDNRVRRVIKHVLHNSTVMMMSLASVLAVVNFARCLLFLGEVKKEDDVNEESIKQLQQYMKEIKKIDHVDNI